MTRFPGALLGLINADTDAPGSTAVPNPISTSQSLLTPGLIWKSVSLLVLGPRESPLAVLSDVRAHKGIAATTLMSSTQGFGMHLFEDPTLYPNT